MRRHDNNPCCSNIREPPFAWTVCPMMSVKLFRASVVPQRKLNCKYGFAPNCAALCSRPRFVCNGPAGLLSVVLGAGWTYLVWEREVAWGTIFIAQNRSRFRQGKINFTAHQTEKCASHFFIRSAAIEFYVSRSLLQISSRSSAAVL